MEELIKQYKEIKDRYKLLNSGYSDIYILMDIKASLTILYGEFGEFVGQYKYDRNDFEHQRHVVLSSLSIQAQDGVSMSQAKADNIARSHPEYETFLKHMSRAYSNWETWKHYAEATKLLSFTVGGHVDFLRRERQ